MIHYVVISIIFIVSIIAYSFRSLSKSGALAAFIVGTFIYIGFKVNGLILLGIFFGTSSLLSLYKSQQKKKLDEKLEKGSKRDWVQVVANGGIAAFCSILYYLTNDFNWVIAFCTSIASATGDTWSSEIGPLSKKQPLSIRNFKIVEAGTSGAVSLLGTISAIIGVGVITIFGYLLLPMALSLAWLSFIFGLLGNGIDTFLGAYFQRTYICRVCSIETEKQFHCEERTKKIRGFTLLNNDAVNLLSSLLAPILAIITYQYFL